MTPQRSTPSAPVAGVVPVWSGTFSELPSGFGMILIHADDRNTYPPPPGWEYTGDAPCAFLGDAEAWLLMPHV